MNVRNRKLQSPLHLAVQQAHVGLVPLLVDAGCSVNAEDEDGDTALHVALRRHQLQPLAADGVRGDPGTLQLLSRVSRCGLGLQRWAMHLAASPRQDLTAHSLGGGIAPRPAVCRRCLLSLSPVWPASLQFCAPEQPGKGSGGVSAFLGAAGAPLTASVCPQLQASGLPTSAELTVGAAVACFLALEGGDVSYANHRGRSPLDLAVEGRVLKALQGCAQRFR